MYTFAAVGGPEGVKMLLVLWPPLFFYFAGLAFFLLSVRCFGRPRSSIRVFWGCLSVVSCCFFASLMFLPVGCFFWRHRRFAGASSEVPVAACCFFFCAAACCFLSACRLFLIRCLRLFDVGASKFSFVFGSAPITFLMFVRVARFSVVCF